MVWLGLGTEPTILGLGKQSGFGFKCLFCSPETWLEMLPPTVKKRSVQL